jgi:CRP/FNR family nitrogen fixation transcriptional regulator
VIACEGDDADYIFLVVSGVVRTCKTFQNGDRAVVAFYLPGDLFGWGDAPRALSVEAAADAIVVWIKRGGLAALAARNANVASLLHTCVCNELQRAQDHAVAVSASAKNRVLAFLRDWMKRSGASSSIRLPMGYQDIADHLGMKIETLSRTITELEQSGVVARSASRRQLRLRQPLPTLRGVEF